MGKQTGQLGAQRAQHMACAHVVLTFAAVAAEKRRQRRQLPTIQRLGQRLRRCGAAGLAVSSQQRVGRYLPRTLQQSEKLLALDTAVFQRGEMGGQRQRVFPGDEGAQLRGGSVFTDGILHRIQPQRDAAGTNGGQQRVQRVGTEHKRGVGRAFLHDLQQHILITLVKLGTVGKQVDLPLTLVGADVDILPQGADGFHRQLLTLRLPDLCYVGVDARHHLAAGVALQAGALRIAAAQVGRGDIAGSGTLVPLAGEDQRMAQTALPRRGTNGCGPCGVVGFSALHGILRGRTAAAGKFKIHNSIP